MAQRLTDRLQHPLPLAASAGEPAGIGPDVLLLAYANRKQLSLHEFFVCGDPDHLSNRAKALGLSVNIESCAPVDVSAIFEHSLPVVALSNSMYAEPGLQDKRDAPAVVEAITEAVAHVVKGTAAGIVTAPINKRSLYDAGFEFPGHTEFLGALASQHGFVEPSHVMMLNGPQLRAVPVTIHIPLSEVPKHLTKELIVKTAQIVERDLRELFAISAPRLAISGLNPHAGEDGALGHEDASIVAPAIAELQNAGIRAIGPLPADTMFHDRARAAFDVALCMYHDQALIPAKALAFDESVNVTLGLPFIRTSPDHGTAYDIAGTGKANASSMIEAIRLAAQLAQNLAKRSDKS